MKSLPLGSTSTKLTDDCPWVVLKGSHQSVLLKYYQRAGVSSVSLLKYYPRAGISSVSLLKYYPRAGVSSVSLLKYYPWAVISTKNKTD
jgi:hypothetical protein